MNAATARILARMTSEFYATVSESFSATRQSAWPGWEQMLARIDFPAAAPRVLDLASGNLRFERFLARRGIAAQVWAYDSCDALVAGTLLAEACDTTGRGALLAEACDTTGRCALQAEACDTTGRSALLAEACDTTGRGALLAEACDTTGRGALQAEACDTTGRGALQVGVRAIVGKDERDQIARGVSARGAIAADVRRPETRETIATDAQLGTLRVRYTHLDIVEALFDGSIAEKLGGQSHDLAVCFGFAHHVALPAQRARLLEALVRSVRPGGYVALSFWQLSRSPRLLAKAQSCTSEATQSLDLAGLGPHDYLLGWQGRTDVLRYCHDFSEKEVDALARSVQPLACEVARYSADGAQGDLNRYLILQRS